VAERPALPAAYGIAAPDDRKGLLPWTWAAERLERSRGYWLATTRTDGRPHVAVVWGVWLDNRFSFATSTRTVKGRNLAANPRCVVCPERAEEAVIVEGVAERVRGRAAIRRFREAYAAKYGEDVDTRALPVHAVTPVLAFGFVSDAAAYPHTATRWRFSGG
jgi:hypothetical protein